MTAGAARFNNRRPYAERIYEGIGEKREEEVEKEARVGFKAQDTSADAEEGGGEVVEGCECLFVEKSRSVDRYGVGGLR